MISTFKGEYGFLSNYYNAPITYKGLTYRNSEAAFHAQKDPSQSKCFTDLNPKDAKRLGRRVHLREDWEQVKDMIMYEVCLAKFTQNEDLKQKLLTTGEEYLLECTTGWHDNYWGSCMCSKCVHIKGENRLGKILMNIRAELAR